MSEEFKIGDLVWAKMKGFPPWPGRVSNPMKKLGKPPAKKAPTFCIFFFGSKNYGWIEKTHIQLYHEHKDTLISSSKTAQFKAAVEAIEDFIAKGEVFEDEIDPDSLFDRLKEDTIVEETKSPKPTKPRKETPKAKRSDSSLGSRPAKKRRESTASNSHDAGSVSPVLNHTSPSPPRKSTSNLLNRPANIARPETPPPLDVGTMSQVLKDKNILPSMLKFGFLGLGIMGSGIVKNLLNSGHTVIVWNRSQEKCNDFVEAGAESVLTPSDVVAAADITFSCVANPQVAKDMVFGNCGVLTEITSEKGYVEMTSIDSETSQDIAEAINAKGGRYLEAQVQGSKKQAGEGTLVLLAAGDKSLFDDCQSCFEAMSKSSYYFGKVGNASRMNLVLQLMSGVTLVGLAECMALADRAEIPQKDVLEVLELTSLACPAIIEQGRAIISRVFPPQFPLKHMQKDLQLTLEMSDRMGQPLPLTAAANEVYKHAKRLGYADHDAAAVYMRAKF